MEIKAIPTEYRGVLYRSRLEAQWAAQLDALGIAHDYEPQGYSRSGLSYLPDFYLPDLDMFAEVKGVPTETDAKKLRMLMIETGKDVVLLLGNGRMQFFSAKFGGYRMNDNFGKGECEYDEVEFRMRVDFSAGRYEPSEIRGTEQETRPEPEVTAESEPTFASNNLEPGTSVNPAALQRLWTAALTDVKRKKQAHAVLFMNTRIRYHEKRGVVEIMFPNQSEFAFNAARRPEVRENVTKSLESAFGWKVGLEYSREGDDGE